MYSKIVIGLDGSEGAQRAIPHATDLAKATGGEIVVVHVDERMAVKGDMPPVHPDEAAIQSAIEDQVAAIRGEGIEVELVKAIAVLGGPGSTIASIAAEADADLIVIGTRGRSSIPGLILGSVAHRLLHIAHRPVLAIPPGSADDR